LISIAESNITSSGFTAVCISQPHQHDLLSSITRIIFCLGAFLVGDTSTYLGSSVVARSIALDEPVIYVSANYRLNGTIFSCTVMWLVFIYSDLALGFLGGKEAQAAGIGNAGIRDRARLSRHYIIALC
jgi:hypothetical protein